MLGLDASTAAPGDDRVRSNIETARARFSAEVQDLCASPMLVFFLRFNSDSNKAIELYKLGILADDEQQI